MKREKAYNAMSAAGAGCIALGVISIIVGVVTGILSVVWGASLLKNRHGITF
jgi:hypothetical protein